jgi:hypothetical protein
MLGKNYQILNFFIIDFKNWKADLEALRWAFQFLNAIKNFIAGNGNYTLILPVADLSR